MMGNSQNGVLQCFVYCLLLLMRIRTDAPGLTRYINSPIVYEEWELRTSLLWYMRQVSHNTIVARKYNFYLILSM